MCLSGTAGAQSPSPNRDAGARRVAQATGAIGAPGVVIRYEEVAGSGVIYLEESGGMVSSVTSPVKATRVPPASPAQAAQPSQPVRPPEATAQSAPPRSPAASPSTVAQRRAAPPENRTGRP